jgi:hypothetical protein
VLFWIFEPLSRTFALAMAVIMAVGAGSYLIYRELRAFSYIRGSRFRVSLGGTTVFTDEEDLARTVEGVAVRRRLPRFVYVGSYPSEVDVRRGVFVGIVNTDVFDGDVKDALRALERPPLWWLDFTSPSGFLLRTVVPIVIMGLSLRVALPLLALAGLLFGVADSANLNMTSV